MNPNQKDFAKNEEKIEEKNPIGRKKKKQLIFEKECNLFILSLKCLLFYP